MVSIKNEHPYYALLYTVLRLGSYQLNRHLMFKYLLLQHFNNFLNLEHQELSLALELCLRLGNHQPEKNKQFYIAALEQACNIE